MFSNSLYFLLLSFVLSTSFLDGLQRSEINPSALEMLRKAYESRGGNVIQSGEFTYEARSVGDVPSKTEIENANRKARQDLLAASQAASDPKAKKHLSDLAKSVKDELGDSLIANADVKLQFFYAFAGPTIGGDHYLECRKWDAKEKIYGKVDFSLLRRYGAGRSDCIWLDKYSSGKIGQIEDVGAVQQSPHFLGRMAGSILAIGIDQFMQSLERIDQRVGQVFEEHDSFILDCELKKGIVHGLAKIRYVVVPSLGYAIPSIKEWDENAKVVFESQCQKYFRDRTSSLMFPAKCDVTVSGVVKSRKENYVFLPEKMSMNIKVAPSRLKVEFPEGADVLLTTKGITLKSHDKIALGIDDIDSIEKNSAFHVFGTSPTKKSLASSNRAYTRYWIFALVTASLLTLTFFVIKRLRVNTIGLLIAASLSQLAGCSFGETDASSIQFVPIIDLGDVVSEQDTIQFNIPIENPQPKAVQVRLEAVCRCVRLNNSDLEINAWGSEVAKGELSLSGKLGRFETKILLGSTHQPVSKDEITVRANVIRHWTAVPKRVILSASGKANLRIIAPDEAWQNVSIDSPVGIEIMEVASHLDQSRNRILDYEVAAKSIDPVSSTIALRFLGNNRPFFSIPVLVER